MRPTRCRLRHSRGDRVLRQPAAWKPKSPRATEANARTCGSETHVVAGHRAKRTRVCHHLRRLRPKHPRRHAPRGDQAGNKHEHRRFNKPAIAQLVEHLTVGCAAIRWSLVRFRVAGFFTRTNDCKGSANHQHAPKARHNQLSEKKIKTTPVGFEPTRGDPIGLAGRRLNRSAKVSLMLEAGWSVRGGRRET